MMTIRTLICTLLATLPLLFIEACSVTPLTPDIQASPNGKGNIVAHGWLSPTIAVRGSYGLTDSLDIGGDLEQLGSYNLWSRLSLVNTPKLAMAATAGVFKSSNANHSQGYFAGAVLSGRITDRFKLFTGYRLSHAKYTAIDIDGPYSPSLSDDQLISGVDSRDPHDLSKTSLYHIGITFNSSPRLGLNLGAICRYHHRNNDPLISSSACAPVIGISMRSRPLH